MAILSPNAKYYVTDATNAANANSIPPEILLGLIQSESSFNPFAVKGNGYGLTQLDSAEAKSGVSNPFDNSTTNNQNIAGGAKYLKSLYDRSGNWRDALSMYNSGYSAARSCAGADYAAKVLGVAGQLGYDPGKEIAPSFLSDPLGATIDTVRAGERGITNALGLPSWLTTAGTGGVNDPLAFSDKLATAKTWIVERAGGFALVVAGGLILIFAAYQLVSDKGKASA